MWFSSSPAAGSKQGRTAAEVCGTGGDQDGERDISFEDHLRPGVRVETGRHREVLSQKYNYKNKITK